MISLHNAAWNTDEDGWPVLVETYTPRHADTSPIEGAPDEDASLFHVGTRRAPEPDLACDKVACTAPAEYIVEIDILMGVRSLLCGDCAQGYMASGAEIHSL